MTLSKRLIAEGTPLLEFQHAHPTVTGIGRGDLPDAVFRRWLEQDYLFLLDYARVFARLAAEAPVAHLGELLDIAHGTYHNELGLHRSLSRPFGADLDGAVKGAACAEYTAFLLEASADYGVGLAAVLPCFWGYAEIGARLALHPPAEPRFRRFVDLYGDPAFRADATRCAERLDEADAVGLVDHGRARAAFLRCIDLELAFWDVD